MDHHPVQPSQSLIANLRSLTESEKWPEFDALEAEFSRSFDAGSEDAGQLREHNSLVQAMQAPETGVHRTLETKMRWAAVEMARVKRVQIRADALMAEAKVMRDEVGREMRRVRAVEDEGESEISRHEEAVASIEGRLGRIVREREGRRVAQERRFKAAVGRLWQTVEDGQGVRHVIPTALRLPPPARSFPEANQPSPPHFPPNAPPNVPPPAHQATGQIPFKRKLNTNPPLPLSHKRPKALTPEHWDPSFLTPEAGLLGSVSWEQFHNDESKYPLYKRWLCQRRPREVRGKRVRRGAQSWVVYKCPAHPAHVIDSQKELLKHYELNHVDVKTSAERMRECAVHVRGCGVALVESHNGRITRDTYMVDWGSEGPVSGGGGGVASTAAGGKQGGGEDVREQVAGAMRFSDSTCITHANRSTRDDPMRKSMHLYADQSLLPVNYYK
ncbi:hypothetical protein PspLS_07687 [Pyricularia sp. CBS 133598]|nr:hypothetical protein PspLS_07687 [Pyricularia sp. CBS 133598]